MERYDNIVKVQEIRNLIDNNDYRQGMLIADTIDIDQIKATTDLSTIAEVLSKNQRYDQAMKVLNIIYDKGRSRRVVYQLLQVSINSKDLPMAKRYYREYLELAPKDPTRYIFQYLIAKLGNRPIEEQITPLKELKKHEYIEEWIYELATLYHKAGMKDKCVEECKDIIVWFGSGDYVKRAKLLKGYYEGEIDLFNLINQGYSFEDEGLEDEELEDDELSIEKNKKQVAEKARTKETKTEEVKTEEAKTEEARELRGDEDYLEEFFAETNINYKEIFDKFIDNNNIRQQIIETLIDLDTTNLPHFNLIISTDENYDSCENTSFSKAMVKVFYRLGYISSSKVGIIDGEIINSIDLSKQKKSLKNCSLIIDNAFLLRDYSIESIEKVILDKDQKIVIVLQGNESKLRRLIEKSPILQKYFPICIRLY